MKNERVLEAIGDFALFSRPDHGKVEMISYPVPTPSVVRSIFDAIYFKPKFRWQPTKIEILLHPKADKDESYPQTFFMRKNMTRHKANARTLNAIDASVADQRQSQLILYPRYRLFAKPVPKKDHHGEMSAILAQFDSRLAAGQHFHQPFFGCREYVAYTSGPSTDPVLDVDIDIGMMSYDPFDVSTDIKGTNDSPILPSCFFACVKNGIMEIPDFSSNKVFKSEPASGR